MRLKPLNRGTLLRELLIFAVFLGITALITWPWVLQLRAGVPDFGDPYAISYFLWWDYHQTFHDPLNLFQATIFYPYRYGLAFGEYDYGVSLLFFPLFALGFRPLTVYSLASFLSFPFTAYCMFRLGRTLSGSTAVAWVAAIILAFVPFRFHHLSHLHLVFAGWIPLVFEALILFVRKRSWGRAGWLAFAFLMNALTCTTWLILTLIPLASSALLLITRNRAWGDRNLWLRGGLALSAAALLLLPFLVPQWRVAREHNFTRSAEEVTKYSAQLMNWLAADERNRVWRGLGRQNGGTEMVLFPGLLAPLLALGAFLLPENSPRNSNKGTVSRRKRLLIATLDLICILAGITALMSIGYTVFRVSLLGHTLLTATKPDRSLMLLLVALLVRFSLAYPQVISNCMRGDKDLRESICSTQRSELFGHALLWMLIGFAGSFGLNFFFHRFLFENVVIFQSMRVATRWAMICYVGLALLAGLGAVRFTTLLTRWQPRVSKWLSYSVLTVAILFELHVAPLKLMHGEVNADTLTLDLKNRTMAGGILELPISNSDHLYMLRAADHGKPLVNGTYSFVPPLPREIAELTRLRPIPEQFFDVLEDVPVSYLTVHYALLSDEEQISVDGMLERGIATHRIRFIKSFLSGTGRDERNDLYAVSKTEPDAKSEGLPPLLNP